MLSNYKSDVEICLNVGWEGWMFMASLDDNENLNSLYNQDYIHNSKKLINLLLSIARTLQLGGDLYLYNCIKQVFHLFTAEEYDLKMEDIEKRNH